MIRVGIVGAENSCALAFARFFNTVDAIRRKTTPGH